MKQLENQIQGSRITQSGGHLYYQSNRMSKRFTGRKMVKDMLSVQTPSINRFSSYLNIYQNDVSYKCNRSNWNFYGFSYNRNNAAFR